MRAEAQASGAEQPPVIAVDHSLPPTINDVAATARLTEVFDRVFGEGTVIDPGMFTGSEDVSWFAREAGAPLVYWFWGGVDPQQYADAYARWRSVFNARDDGRAAERVVSRILDQGLVTGPS